MKHFAFKRNCNGHIVFDHENNSDHLTWEDVLNNNNLDIDGDSVIVILNELDSSHPIFQDIDDRTMLEIEKYGNDQIMIRRNNSLFLLLDAADSNHILFQSILPGEISTFKRSSVSVGQVEDNTQFFERIVR